MGVVFHAYDRELELDVALKTIRGGHVGALQRFKYEFRALADVSHPNLVTLYELHYDEKDWFFTMELVEGVDFIAHVSSDLPLADGPPDTRTLAPLSSKPTASTNPVAEAAPDAARAMAEPSYDRLRAGVLQLVDGLHRLHCEGFLHRDVKPSNVMMTADGRAVLLDFGVITELNRADDRPVGTPAYMSPEQASGGACGYASDWYALGVMMYQAIAGVLPFRAQPRLALELKTRMEPTHILELRPTCPPQLARLTMGLLARDPAQRPSASEIQKLIGRRRRPLTRPRLERPSLSPLPLQRQLCTEIARHVIGSERSLHLVEGAPGAGRTSLLSLLQQEVFVPRGYLVLSARCYERESVPYRAMDGLVDALGAYLDKESERDRYSLLPGDFALLAQLFPVLEGLSDNCPRPTVSDRTVVRGRAARALRELIARIASRQRLALIFDDLQWGDLDSAPFFEAVLAPALPSDCVCIMAHNGQRREGGLVRRLTELPAVKAAFRHNLGSLAQADLEILADVLLPEGTSLARRQAVMNASSGSPMVLRVLADSLSDDGWMPPLEGELSLDGAIRGRLAHLDQSRQSALQVVAIAGKPLDQMVARKAAGLDSADWARVVRSLTADHLAASSGVRRHDKIWIHHPVIAEAIVGLVPETPRRAIHLELARALIAARDALPEDVGFHLKEAGEWKAAVPYVLEGARSAEAAFAFDRAADLYRKALELDADREDRQDHLVRLGECLASAGRGRESAAAFDEASRRGKGKLAARLAWRSAEQLMLGGYLEEALARFRSVLPRYGLPAPRPRPLTILDVAAQRARLAARGLKYRLKPSAADDRGRETLEAAWSASVVLAVADPVTAFSYFGRYLLGALDSGDVDLICKGLVYEAAYRAMSGSRGASSVEELLQESGALAQDASGQTLAFWNGMASFAFCCLGRWTDSMRHGKRATELASVQRGHNSWELHAFQLYRLVSGVFSGQWSNFDEEVELALRGATARGDMYATTNLRTRIMPYVLLARDQPEAAAAEAADAAEDWNWPTVNVQHIWAYTSRLDAVLYARDAERLLELWPTAWREIRTSIQYRQIQHLRVEAGYLRGRVALFHAGTDRAGALHELRKAISGLRRERVAWATVLRLMLQGSYHQLVGNDEAATRALVQAVGFGVEAEMPLHVAAVRLRLGQMLGEAGRSVERQGSRWLAEHGFVSPDACVEMLMPSPGSR